VEAITAPSGKTKISLITPAAADNGEAQLISAFEPVAAGEPGWCFHVVALRASAIQLTALFHEGPNLSIATMT